jgi:Leucine-rich repeat (LRR) protein
MFDGLTALQELNLNHNRFTGDHLPTTLGLLPDLQHLTLHNNNLSGSIPTEWGGMTMLETLQVQNNNLVGSFPLQLGKL